ncbi:hypothetical protein KGP17_11095 [Serratia sp. JSRIV001]|uniref:hypothetical protein n=1 Tax=unclassified Serratia (in: enterobacteria) TaxID=2647522 RepID=UPI001CC0D97C|nr:MULTISPECIES: hypothetical protein [unclassified Serratia (in: enterobacteria)]UAN48027.1 hypothetical protein KGP17_11095 [Serratia sp. JSRIV001]UAN53808.1 hypothetical protein KGP26_12450 [Serratia sp. JSRIV002]UAN65133.1 hypothetical protein KGP16_11415 [Serratia sp. JSRIV006]
MSKRRYDNRKARIEKKFSTEAMRLLIALMPRQYPADAFELEWGYSNDEWTVTTVDYWGEADSYDAFYLLHRSLIDQTTDWAGMGNALDAAGWVGDEREKVDESPFYSPWRLGGEITRSVIIRHCRQLVKAGVSWEYR